MPAEFQCLPAQSSSSPPGCCTVIGGYGHSRRRFDPSRFLPGAPPPDRFAYLPFGIGPRVCIGAQFALTEATLVLAAVVQAFRIERASKEPVVPVAIVTTQPDHPPLFRLYPRREAP